jgi:hypothetical protein
VIGFGMGEDMRGGMDIGRAPKMDITIIREVGKDIKVDGIGDREDGGREACVFIYGYKCVGSML